jgi:hypothetical protein
MDWNVGFPVNSFGLAKSWKHDSSVVYKFESLTGELGVAMNWILPAWKCSVIFLKVQIGSFPDAHEAVRQSGLPIWRDAKNGVPTDFKAAIEKTFEPETALEGRDIMNWVEKNKKNIEILCMEIGCLRIYTIVFAPKGDAIRIKDMKDFISENYKLQVGAAKVDNVVKTPIKLLWGALGLSHGGYGSS